MPETENINFIPLKPDEVREFIGFDERLWYEIKENVLPIEEGSSRERD